MDGPDLLGVLADSPGLPPENLYMSYVGVVGRRGRGDEQEAVYPGADHWEATEII